MLPTKTAGSLPTAQDRSAQWGVGSGVDPQAVFLLIIGTGVKASIVEHWTWSRAITYSILLNPPDNSRRWVSMHLCCR
jgi:hypothetical protein